MKQGLATSLILLVICVAGLVPVLRAEGFPVGTWVRRPNKDGLNSTMFVEAAGAGQKFTLKFSVAGGATSTMVVTTEWDGKDAQVLLDGKPSGQTMAIRKLDDHHTINVIKMNGRPMGTQKGEVSADGKLITVQTIPAVLGGQTGVEYWDKK
jgi:hypothetical protein